MQGVVPCAGCAVGCYQCGGAALQPGDDAALAWDMGEIYGQANPTTLPAPTTSSLARTVVMWPRSGTFARLDIEDAERCQGMEPGHTALPPGSEAGSLKPPQVRTERFKCVGNALHGKVWPTHASILFSCRRLSLLQAPSITTAAFAGAWGDISQDASDKGVRIKSHDSGPRRPAAVHAAWSYER
jgi:hypothetical protein